MNKAVDCSYSFKDQLNDADKLEGLTLKEIKFYL